MSETTPVNSAPTPADCLQLLANASHPWVYSATVTPGGITFSVEVTDIHTTAGAIEITGTATQVNGAFAPIYYITDVPDGPNGDKNDDDQKCRYFVNVPAIPTPGHVFDPNEDLTVFIRVSKVWVTVIGSGIDGPAKPNIPIPTWGIHKADSHIVAPDGAPKGATLQAP